MHAQHEQQSRHLHELAQDRHRRNHAQPHTERRLHAHRRRHSQQECDSRRELLEFVYGKSTASAR